MSLGSPSSCATFRAMAIPSPVSILISIPCSRMPVRVSFASERSVSERKRIPSGTKSFSSFEFLRAATTRARSPCSAACATDVSNFFRSSFVLKVHKSRTMLGAPRVIIHGISSLVTTAVLRFRSESPGVKLDCGSRVTSISFALTITAFSSALSSAGSVALIAKSIISFSSFAASMSMLSTWIRFSVSVPVLSERSIFTLASSSSAESRRTIACFFARFTTPTLIIRLITVGSAIGIPAIRSEISSVASSMRFIPPGRFRRNIERMTITMIENIDRKREIIIMSFSKTLRFFVCSTEARVFPK